MKNSEKTKTNVQKNTWKKWDFFEGLVLSKNTHICEEFYTTRHEKAWKKHQKNIKKHEKNAPQIIKTTSKLQEKYDPKHENISEKRWWKTNGLAFDALQKMLVFLGKMSIFLKRRARGERNKTWNKHETNMSKTWKNMNKTRKQTWEKWRKKCFEFSLKSQKH